jgi:hypothetical protein
VPDHYPETQEEESLLSSQVKAATTFTIKKRTLKYLLAVLTDRSFFSFAVSFGLTFFLGIPVDEAFGMLVDAFLVVAFVVYVVSNSWVSVNVVLSASESGGGMADAAFKAASSAKRAFSSNSDVASSQTDNKFITHLLVA